MISDGIKNVLPCLIFKIHRRHADIFDSVIIAIAFLYGKNDERIWSASPILIPERSKEFDENSIREAQVD